VALIEFPESDGVGWPLKLHCIEMVPPVLDEGVAVSVVVCPGSKEVSGCAFSPMVGRVLTCNVVGVEATGVVQVALETRQRYRLLFMALVVVASESEKEVAPAMSVQLLPPFVLSCHWNIAGGMLVAAIPKLAGAPAHTSASKGERVMVAGACTVSAAAAEVTLLPQVPVTTQRYWLPEKLTALFVRVRLLVVAPL